MNISVDLFCYILACVTIFCAAEPLEVAHPWNCSTETDLCILTPPMRLSWQEASAYCFQRSGGLSHSDNFELFRSSLIWSSSEKVWIGLGWVESRLQWMTHVPHEEINITKINDEAIFLNMKNYEGKLCYSLRRNGNIGLMNCTTPLSFICVRLLTTNEDYFPENSTFLGINNPFPELFPLGEFSRIKHSDLFLIEPSNETNFNLHCKVSRDMLETCSKTHYRWLKNGAYKPDSDGKKNLFGSSEESSTHIMDNKTLISNWIGKVACEIFCFSTGKTYRSEEIILSLRQFLTLRIDFTFNPAYIFFRDAEQYIKKEMQNRLKDQITSQVVSINHIGLPQFIRHVNNSSIDTFRFYANIGPLGDDDIFHLANYVLRNIDFIDESEKTSLGWFKKITVSVVNYRSQAVETDFTSVRSTDFCQGEITSNKGDFIQLSDQPRNLTDELYWPQSIMGFSVASAPYCVTHDGLILRRRCLGDRSSGLYWESLNNTKSGVNESLCVETSGLFQKLANVNADNPFSQILETIRHNNSDWNPIVAEVDLLGQLLLKSYSYINDDPNDENLRNVVAVIKEIHDMETDTLIRVQKSCSFSSNLAQATEKILATINRNDSVENTTSQEFQLKKPYIAAGSWNRVDNNDSDVIGFTVMTNEKRIVGTSVLSSLPTKEEIQQSNTVVLLPFQEIYEKEQVVFIAYPDTRLIDASAASGKWESKVFTPNSSQPEGWSQTNDLYTGNSGMVQVHLNPAPPRLHKPITILFRPKCLTTEEDKHLLRCVFWNEQMDSGNGGWSTEGCWYNGRDQNGMEICFCNHLSTFTLLVSRSEKGLQCTVHGAILNIITLIGSSASILGLSFILATFILFPPWRKPLGHKILFQLSAALIFLLLTFTFGVDSTQNVDVCRLVAIFLHYFLLSGFCWMTIEAYHQYQRFTKVFGAYMPRFLLKASILAWGLPIVPIASVLIYDVDSYSGSEGYCWLSHPIAFYSAVLGPLIFLMFLNFAIFVLVVRSIIAAGRGLRTNQSDSKQIRQKILASFMNFVLLGLTWIFGFFAIGTTNAVIFSYLFCVTSSLQGFIIFVLFVGRDRSARKLWLKCFGLGKSESRPMESKTKPSANSKTTENYESSSTTFTSGNNFTLTFPDDVQYLEIVPIPTKVLEAKRELNTHIF